MFRQVQKAEYWQGVHEAGGIPASNPLRILAYHSIADLSDNYKLRQYGIPPKIFRHQLDTMLQFGFRFVTPSEVIRFLQGIGGLPRQAVLLTFDDGYKDLLDTVLPILSERRIPAAVFIVSNWIGRTNDWDQALGGGQLDLLNIDELLQLEQAGIEIGAHSRTHRILKSLPAEELTDEIWGSITDLEAIGVQSPQLFAYPYGEYDEKSLVAVREAGIKAAFTIDPGLVKSGQDPFRIPRNEILRSDTGWKFWHKVFLTGYLERYFVTTQASSETKGVQ
jgi:peptidoglycan/xylan/chitin deacetylase (PgdA/CDA1 family)